jgi:O-antigen biosynthesis protein
MKTSIIILTHNQLDYTKRCLESIIKYTKEGSYEIIIVDNHSTDGTVEWLKQQNNIKVIFNNENLGFPKGCNQGIEIATGENILLLNNDTIVTKSWLDNLLTCLYSSDDIGAVGPVTNSAAYYSTIPVNYTSIDEMHEFAASYNVSDPNKWEERLKLIGFCMLIKREAVDKVGLLDERFTPGNFEDDDYSVRLRKAGYRLMLCKDTFIHHYGSVSWKKDVNAFGRLLSENEKKFKEKWGTDSSSYIIHKELIDQVHFPLDSELNVLQIGCQAGATLLEIKNRFKNARLYGVETNEAELNEAKQLGNIYENINDVPNVKFDLILFTDDELLLTEELLKKLILLLKENGVFLGKFLNIGYYKIVQQILSGQQPFIHHANYYSYVQLETLFKQLLNIKWNITGLSTFMNDGDRRFISDFERLYGNNIKSLLEAHYFIMKGKMVNQKLLALLKQINEKEEFSEELAILNKYEFNEIFDLIKLVFEKPIEILQKIAIQNFYIGNHDYVIPYLQEAFELDSNNIDTLYNIAFILSAYGEYELANKYICMIDKNDDSIQELREFIKRQLDTCCNEDGNVMVEKNLEANDIVQIEQNDVQFTGERIVINKFVKENFNDVLEEHLARYKFASQFVKDKVVLDAACGTGYGTKMLQASGAKSVIGVDVSHESLESAKRMYSAENIQYLYGDVNALNFESQSFDIVVSFETIEHIENGYNWIKESARVLKENGLFIVSTPNRAITNPGTYFDEKPLNKYHKFEYNFIEFVGELLKEYDIIELFGQTFIPDHQFYYSQLMRKIRNLDINYIPSTFRDYPKYELLPLNEVKDATPTFIVALCRKKVSKNLFFKNKKIT